MNRTARNGADAAACERQKRRLRRAAMIARLAERCDGLAVILDETSRPAEAAAARNIADDLRDLVR